jgi:hypothetical protein
MNKKLAGYVGDYRAEVISSPALNPIVVDDYTVEPRPIVTALLNRLASDSVGFLEEALGRSAQ